jgi:2-polyprenyl-3-methyl-5-hydroxy-6-metoxy-1,4-benzoquinol methylase
MASFSATEFAKIQQEEEPAAQHLASILIERYNPSSVIDAGCANGLYLKPFLDRRIDVLGYELSGEAFANAQIPNHRILIRDLSEPLQIKKADLAICLEVMEHIPEEDAGSVLDNLCQMADTIIFSAAIPGQGGHGHINCQYKEYWLALFTQRGFHLSLIETQDILDKLVKGSYMGWLKQNLMVMKRA